jgi:hypothetical protein
MYCTFIKGALFCGITVWGHLQLRPGTKARDIELYKFLRDYTGILLTKECLWLGCDNEELNVSVNRSKHAHFDLALERICANPNKVEKYSSTISNGMDLLKKEELLSVEKILEVKDNLQSQCEAFGWNVRPGGKAPVKTDNERGVVRLLGKCLCHAECEKAPGVEDFPGDFDESPELLENVRLNLRCEFNNEMVSTGYYVPAGVSLLINVCECESDDLSLWSCQIGAHTDDLSNCQEYKRWPSVVVKRRLKTEQMSLCSPFGGLVYFTCERKSHIRVMLNNVVESPMFDITKRETVDDWNENRLKAPGLW